MIKLRAVTRGRSPGWGDCPDEVGAQWGDPPRGGVQTALVPSVGTQRKEPAAPCWGGQRQERSSRQVWAWAPPQGSPGGVGAPAGVEGRWHCPRCRPGRGRPGDTHRFWAPHTCLCEAPLSTVGHRRLGQAPAHSVLPPNLQMRNGAEGFSGAMPLPHACRDTQHHVPTAYLLPPGSPKPQGEVEAGVAQSGTVHRRDTVAGEQGGSWVRAGVNVGHPAMKQDTVTGHHAQASHQLVPH